MFGKPITLFKAFGFPIRIDASWLLLALLMTYFFAQGVLPQVQPGLSNTEYWPLGVVCAIGLFVSVILHELTHAVVARTQGIPMKGITLFLLGGVAEMDDEPPHARGEFLMAIVGPLASLVIAVALYFADLFGTSLGWSVLLLTVLKGLAVTNLSLAIFNMLPAFPLDGGRVLRSILWWARKDLRWATRIASTLGQGFGFALMAWGIVRVFGGDVWGLWMFVIGLFLRAAARAPYQQLVVKQSLEGEHVRRFMKADPVTVPRSIPVRELVEEYFYRYQYKMFPVVEDGRLIGCVTLDRVRKVPRDEWNGTSVGSLMAACDADNTIGPDEDAMVALSRMGRTGATRLMVVEDGRLVGIITLRDLLAYIRLKMELERR